MKYGDYDKMMGFQEEMKIKRKEAFKFINSCRDKEIDRFWTRGLYFWGFIAASFGAYMAVFNAALENDCKGEKVPISLEAILSMDFTAKVALFVLSFICFVFCLSWLYVHKGSKFWQENWEAHLCCIEKDYRGKIYKTWLDTNNDNDFSKCPIKTKAYDFSVSKISLLCSMLLSFCSFGLVLFHCFIFVKSFFAEKINFVDSNCIKIIVPVIIVLLSIAFMIGYFRRINGNVDSKKSSCYEPGYYYFKKDGETIGVKK